MDGIDMINPIEQCAREYWPKLIGQHKKYHSGWDLPGDWREVSPDTRIITKTHIIQHAMTPYRISLGEEHAAWVLKKRMAGWNIGSYNPIEKRHPYLEPFDICPGHFQEITNFFCRAAEKWRPLVLEYLAEFEKPDYH